jgi:hypothetical protein
VDDSKQSLAEQLSMLQDKLTQVCMRLEALEKNQSLGLLATEMLRPGTRPQSRLNFKHRVWETAGPARRH